MTALIGRAVPQVLSLGAGVQSTTLLLLAAEGRIPPFDLAVFADTGWEPAAVYRHLERIERDVAAPAGIEVHRVSVGNIRADALDPTHAFASMPLFVRNPDGSRGRGRRQCTAEYKIRPIQEAVRTLLGAKPKSNGRPGRVANGRHVESAIGISRDEVTRAKDSQVRYQQHTHPLLDLPGAADGRPGWMRSDCVRYLRTRGYPSVAKSACIGCPFRRNASWRRMRDQQPDEFADACAFDAAIRAGYPRALARGKDLRGSMYLHESRTPLADAPIEHVTRPERAARQTNLLDAIADTEAGLTDPDDDPDTEVGCSPFTCAGDLAAGAA